MEEAFGGREKMRKMLLICGALFFWVLPFLSAEEKAPASSGEIQAALARGEALRQKKHIVADMLQSYTVLTKIGGEPCGFARVALEDAQGEGSATYRLVEQFTATVANSRQRAKISYNGSYLLGADLGLVSGTLHAQTDSKSADKEQKVHLSARIETQDGNLTWQVEQRDQDGKTQPLREKQSLDLHGVRPIPSNALNVLASFAANKESICVPALEINWQMISFDAIPAWLSFVPPAAVHPPGATVAMLVRYLVGEITDKGLAVEVPTPEVWGQVAPWLLDNSGRVLALPPQEDLRLTIELGSGKETSPDFDMNKIEAVTKKFEEIKQQQMQAGETHFQPADGR